MPIELIKIVLSHQQRQSLPPLPVLTKSRHAKKNWRAIHEEEGQFIKKVLTFQLNKFLFTLQTIFWGVVFTEAGKTSAPS